MIEVSRQANFGSRKTGLSTVGYALLNEDGTTKQARATTGVSELIAGSGAYGAVISFEDTWRGIIIWDTGEATPLYAFDSFNYSEYSGGGGGGFVVQGEFLNQAEKEQIFNLLNNISKTVKTLDVRTKGIEESITNLDSRLLNLVTSIQAVKGSMKFEDIVKKVGLAESGLTEILDSIKKMILLSEGRTRASTKVSLEAIASHVQEAQVEISKLGNDKSLGDLKGALAEIKEVVDLSIKIGARLIKTEDLQSLLKEGGFDVAKITG